MPPLQNALSSLFWPLLEAVSAVLAGVVAVLVIAGIIGAEAFGLGSIALGIVLVLQVGVNSLVHDALVRSERLLPDDVDVAFTASLVAAVSTGLLAALAAPLVSQYLNQERLSVLIWAFLPMLLLSALPMTMIAERRRSLDFSTVAHHQIAGRVLGTLAGILAALWGAGVWSLVIQSLSAAAYTFAALALLAPRWPRLRFSWRRLAPMLSFCSPIIGSQLLIHGTSWLFLISMGRWHGLIAAGHWSVATRIAESLLGGITQAVYNVALARLALHQTARDRLTRALMKGQALAAVAAIPLLVALAAVAEPLMVLLLGPSWAPAGRLALGPLVGSFLLIRQLLPSTALRVVGNSTVSLTATLANAMAAAAGLILFGGYSPYAVSAVYALSILPGYTLLFMAAVREFHLSWQRELLTLGRDLTLAVAAFAFGRNLAGQLSEPSPLVDVIVAGCAAFMAAAMLLMLIEPKFFRTIFEHGRYQRPVRSE
jgi:O-antigen/teichoic acid export membrane protein